MSDASIQYDASAVSLDGLTPQEIRNMKMEIEAFMDSLFEKYGVEVARESSTVDTGIKANGPISIGYENE